jgi:hypothetical protein
MRDAGVGMRKGKTKLDGSESTKRQNNVRMCVNMFEPREEKREREKLKK